MAEEVLEVGALECRLRTFHSLETEAGHLERNLDCVCPDRSIAVMCGTRAGTCWERLDSILAKVTSASVQKYVGSDLDRGGVVLVWEMAASEEEP
jgi:hypothetical protein